MVLNVLLNKLRREFNIFINKIASYLAKTGFKPIYLTLSSLLFALLALLSITIYESILLYILFTLTSGLLDSLDGAVARLLNKTSKLGAFLDSTLDRLSDTFLIYPLLYIGFNYYEVILLITLSLLISYVRARGESLGLNMEGIGLIERAERIILILLVFTTSIFNKFLAQIVLYILIALSVITLIQRILYAVLELERK